MVQKILSLFRKDKRPYTQNNVVWLNTAGYKNY